MGLPEGDRPPMPGAPSWRTPGSHWQRNLLDCASVVVLDADTLSARIEVAGVPATAYHFDTGLCVGLCLAVDPSPPLPWLHETTLSLAASPCSCDDALSWDGRRWRLWHRYEAAITAAELEQGLALQLALARRIAENAREPEGGPGSDIGRLI